MRRVRVLGKRIHGETKFGNGKPMRIGKISPSNNAKINNFRAFRKIYRTNYTELQSEYVMVEIAFCGTAIMELEYC